MICKPKSLGDYRPHVTLIYRHASSELSYVHPQSVEIDSLTRNDRERVKRLPLLLTLDLQIMQPLPRLFLMHCCLLTLLLRLSRLRWLHLLHARHGLSLLVLVESLTGHLVARGPLWWHALTSHTLRAHSLTSHPLTWYALSADVLGLRLHALLLLYESLLILSLLKLGLHRARAHVHSGTWHTARHVAGHVTGHVAWQAIVHHPWHAASHIVLMHHALISKALTKTSSSSNTCSSS